MAARQQLLAAMHDALEGHEDKALETQMVAGVACHHAGLTLQGRDLIEVLLLVVTLVSGQQSQPGGAGLGCACRCLEAHNGLSFACMAYLRPTSPF